MVKKNDLAHPWNWDRHHDGSDIHHHMGDVRMTEWTATFTPSMGWIVRGCKVKPVTSSHGFVCGLNEEDAKLIASAPELLIEVEQLKEVIALLHIQIAKTIRSEEE